MRLHVFMSYQPYYIDKFDVCLLDFSGFLYVLSIGKDNVAISNIGYTSNLMSILYLSVSRYVLSAIDGKVYFNGHYRPVWAVSKVCWQVLFEIRLLFGRKNLKFKHFNFSACTTPKTFKISLDKQTRLMLVFMSYP